MSQQQSLSDEDLKLFSVSTWHELFHAFTEKTIVINMPIDILSLFKDEDIDITNYEDNPALNIFSSELKCAISNVGGTAFIKNNWHAPKDASMFSLGHLLKVTNAKDALMYLRCSEIISEDFEKTMDIPFCVCLRPWLDLHPATEMRCIVVHCTLVGITPRDWPRYFGHFEKDSDSIIKKINEFFVHNIIKFPAKHYTFDIVIKPENMVLWDFGPLNKQTELYAFEWGEIENLIKNKPKEIPPVFRYIVEETLDVQQIKHNLFYPNKHYLS